MFVFKFMFSSNHKHTNLLKNAKNYFVYFSIFFTPIIIPVAQACFVRLKSPRDSKSCINFAAFS